MDRKRIAEIARHFSVPSGPVALTFRQVHFTTAEIVDLCYAAMSWDDHQAAIKVPSQTNPAPKPKQIDGEAAMRAVRQMRPR